MATRQMPRPWRGGQNGKRDANPMGQPAPDFLPQMTHIYDDDRVMNTGARRELRQRSQSGSA